MSLDGSNIVALALGIPTVITAVGAILKDIATRAGERHKERLAEEAADRARDEQRDEELRADLKETRDDNRGLRDELRKLETELRECNQARVEELQRYREIMAWDQSVRHDLRSIAKRIINRASDAGLPMADLAAEYDEVNSRKRPA